MIQHFYSYGYKENHGSNGHMHQCSLQHRLHTQDMEGTQVFSERRMDKRRCGTFVQWSTTQPLKQIK